MKKKSEMVSSWFYTSGRVRGESNAVQPQPAGRTTACTTLPKSERGPHAAPAPGARRGGRAGVRAPGAAGAGPRPAHPSARRCPEGPAGGSRGGGEWASSRGRPAAAPSPTPSRKAHLPRRAPEAAGGHGGAGRPGARQGAGARGPGGGMLGPTGAPNPSPAASPRTPASPEPATPPPSGCTRPRGHELVGQPWRGRASWRGSGRLRRQSRCGASSCPPRPLPPGPAPSAPGRVPRETAATATGLALSFPPPQSGARGRPGPGWE